MIAFQAEAAPRRAPRKRSRLEAATTLYRKLIKVLSPRGECANCGAKRCKLEVDHVDGRDWKARAMSRPNRVDRYWNEYRDGVRLRALCRSCNAVDGCRRQWEKLK